MVVFNYFNRYGIVESFSFAQLHLRYFFQIVEDLNIATLLKKKVIAETILKFC